PARSGYTSGPLFRASVNGRSGPLSYDAAHNRWQKYCAAVGTGIGILQLRHAHASELINSGVSIEVVRRRLGHASTETTQVYTLLADKVADTEIRTARRRDRKSTRLNSSHRTISYAVFCLKKKKTQNKPPTQ